LLITQRIVRRVRNEIVFMSERMDDWCVQFNGGMGIPAPEEK